MNVEPAGNWRMESGTVTMVFIPIRSTATMAVKILVKLAGAHAARALDCQRKRPVSRLTRATSCASIAGAGIGRGVGAGRATAVGSGATGVGTGTGDGVTGGMRSGRGSAWSTGTEAAISVGGCAGAAEPSVLLNAPVTITTAVSRRADRPMQVRQPSAEGGRKQEDAPYNVARAGMTE